MTTNDPTTQATRAAREELHRELAHLDRELLEADFASDLEDGFDAMCKTLEKCAAYGGRIAGDRALEMLAALKAAFGGSVETSQLKTCGGVPYIARRHEAFGLDELRKQLFGASDGRDEDRAFELEGDR